MTVYDLFAAPLTNGDPVVGDQIPIPVNPNPTPVDPVSLSNAPPTLGAPELSQIFDSHQHHNFAFHEHNENHHWHHETMNNLMGINHHHHHHHDLVM